MNLSGGVLAGLCAGLLVLAASIPVGIEIRKELRTKARARAAAHWRRPGGRGQCFSHRMRVSTPNGSIPIGDLKVGDEVWSFDPERQTFIPNKVVDIRDHDDRPFGVLVDLPTPIEVSSTHPFYHPASASYRSLSKIDGDDNLLQVDVPDGASPMLTPRGCYRESGERAKLRDLTLEKEPKNFVVEGILAHNLS